MHVGASIIFQNPGKQQPDYAVWQDELALVDLIEPLGFDSVWATEHHITDYIMCPDPVQFLAYAAGRTTTAKLGTMVVVLPWRDPFRVDGRACEARPGIRRGAARVDAGVSGTDGSGAPVVRTGGRRLKIRRAGRTTTRHPEIRRERRGPAFVFG